MWVSKRYWRFQGGLSPCSEPPLSTVRPDPPQELILQQRGEQLHLAWAPPASWPLPKSYFALLYHLQYELHNGTQVTGGVPAQATPCPHPALCPPCPIPDSSLCLAQPWPLLTLLLSFLG